MKILALFIAVFRASDVTLDNLNRKLSALVSTKCFSRIKIRLDEECKAKKLMETCTHLECKVDNNYDKDSDLDDKLCKVGKYEGNKCRFVSGNTLPGMFVDLEIAKQIYSGYKQGAAEIWRAIHEKAQDNRDLNAAVSGIHLSIGAHMAMYYKKIGNEYYAYPRLYKKKYKPRYFKNLCFAFHLVQSAVSKLKPKMYACSVDIDDLVKDQVGQIVKLTKKTIRNNPYIPSQCGIPKKFRKIMSYLNCIECDKCKLWGKIQFEGLQTAFRLLDPNDEDLKLSGVQLVNLMHLYHKLASSLIFSHVLKNPFNNTQ